jgi:hypothetical protein
MKWGHSYEIKGPERLLHPVLEWVISQSASLDCWLKDILKPGGGLGGDPGWEIEHITSQVGAGSYRIWADPVMSGIEPSEFIYSAEKVRQALRESLIAFAEAYPEKEAGVQAVLRNYNLQAH